MDTSMHKYTVYVTKQENGYKKPGKQQRNNPRSKEFFEGPNDPAHLLFLAH